MTVYLSLPVQIFDLSSITWVYYNIVGLFVHKQQKCIKETSCLINHSTVLSLLPQTTKSTGTRLSC